MTEQEPSAPKPSHYRHMLRGSFWGIAMRWSIRGIGLLSVVILARLLTPDDFGIMAMAALAIGFIAGMSELGTQILLIREPEIDRGHIDTAWSIKVLQGVAVAAVIVALIPLAVDYFGEPRIESVMYVLALVAIVEGAENVGMVLVRKELDFARDFRFNVYKRVFQFVVTIALAVILQNYWALVAGQLVTAIFGLGLSFIMHPYRPRWSLVQARMFLRFALSIIPLNVGWFLNRKVDVAVVGGLEDTATVGVYNVAGEISSMVTQEIVLPLGRGLMPNYAKLAGDVKQLAIAYRHVLSTVAIVCIPIGCGLWATASGFVQVVLGEQWLGTIPLIKWLAIYGVLASINQLMSGQILVVTGHERLSAILMWARLVLLVPATVLAGKQWGLEGVAVATVVSAGSILPVIAYCMTRCLPLSVGDVVKALWRPTAAALGMVAAVRFAHLDLASAPGLAFGFDVLVGALAYVVLLLLLWRMSGRPEGVERAVTGMVLRRLKG